MSTPYSNFHTLVISLGIDGLQQMTLNGLNKLLVRSPKRFFLFRKHLTSWQIELYPLYKSPQITILNSTTQLYLCDQIAMVTNIFGFSKV